MSLTTNDMAHTLIAKLSKKDEKKLLKAFLLCCLYQLFCELFKNKIQLTDPTMEHYEMDRKIMQMLIHDILATGEYTLEGIAYHTHIPDDVIYDAAYGINNQFSITLWEKMGELYMEVKPDVTLALINKLLELKDRILSLLSLPQGQGM